MAPRKTAAKPRASAKKKTAKKTLKAKAVTKATARRGGAAIVEDIEELDAGASPRSSTLVIVESPGKAKTIGKYLGRGYRVRATVGHIIDLPAKKLGIDIEHGFKPDLVPIPGKEKTIAELKSAAKDSKRLSRRLRNWSGPNDFPFRSTLQPERVNSTKAALNISFHIALTAARRAGDERRQPSQ